VKKFKEIKTKIDIEKFCKILSSQKPIDIFDVIKNITGVDISDPEEHLITRDGLYKFFKRIHKDIKHEYLLAVEYSDSTLFNFELMYGLIKINYNKGKNFKYFFVNYTLIARGIPQNFLDSENLFDDDNEPEYKKIPDIVYNRIQQAYPDKLKAHRVIHSIHSKVKFSKKRLKKLIIDDGTQFI